MLNSKLFSIIRILQGFIGTITVLLFVAVVLLGLLTPKVDFQETLITEFEPGYAALTDEFNHYVLPTTMGGFLYDTKAGYVYVDTLGRFIPEGHEDYLGDNLKLVKIDDTLSSFDFEEMVQEKSRIYYISMYLNVLLALLVIVIFDYYNLIVRIRNSRPLGIKLKLFSKPIVFSSSAIVIVSAIFLILNIYQNGILDFGNKALAEPSIYYTPYEESQGSFYVDTSLGFLEYGNGQVYLESESIPIIRSMYVYDGHIVHSINSINPNDQLINTLIGFILVFTALFVVNKFAQFNVNLAGRSKKGDVKNE